MEVKPIEKCRLCGSTDFEKLFSLGDPIQKFRPGQSVIVFAVPESETERFKKLTRK